MQTVNDRADFLIKLKPHLPENCKAIELGVLRGEFSEMILNVIDPKKLYLIDPFKIGKEKYSDGLPTAYSNSEDYRFVRDKFINDKRVNITSMFSYHAAEYFLSGLIDFIYIDASHLYEDVKRDLSDWYPKLKKGGILAGHDYIVNGDFGVIQAVDEFCKEHNLEIFLFNNNGGDWAIK